MRHAVVLAGRCSLPAHALAMGFSLGHVILDWHAENFGPLAPAIRPTQALVLVLSASLYPLWALALVLADRGSRVALLTTFALCTRGATLPSLRRRAVVASKQ